MLAECDWTKQSGACSPFVNAFTLGGLLCVGDEGLCLCSIVLQ